MIGYDLSNFKNGKAFIHFDGVLNGKFEITKENFLQILFITVFMGVQKKVFLKSVETVSTDILI